MLIWVCNEYNFIARDFNSFFCWYRIVGPGHPFVRDDRFVSGIQSFLEYLEHLVKTHPYRIQSQHEVVVV